MESAQYTLTFTLSSKEDHDHRFPMDQTVRSMLIGELRAFARIEGVDLLGATLMNDTTERMV